LVEEVGFIDHPAITGSGASPDGLVGEGCVEFKCPNTATHLDTLLADEVPGKYITQMQWQMACTGRPWCDFVSFDDRLPERLQMFVKRVQRDDKRIAKLEAEVRKFLAEVDEKVTKLKEFNQ
jgi:predicted phage-related endonuclease